MKQPSARAIGRAVSPQQWRARRGGRELAKSVRKGTRAEQLHELGDALAWLTSLANQLGLSMDEAVERYASGCPRCASTPCRCPL